MSSIKHAVIAAAGLGSRLGIGKPKCLIEIGGKTLLEHQINLLNDVEDVRIVVGFEEEQVITSVRTIRPDILVVRNPAFRSTTTLQSYFLGAKYITEKTLFMDADILFQPKSFRIFLEQCNPNRDLIGITKAKTKDAVYVNCEENKILEFSRSTQAPYEWANLSWLSPEMLNSKEYIAVFEQLSKFLPLHYQEIDCYEVDTQEDLENLKKNY